MAFYLLSGSAQRDLATKAETGMGFQVVRGRLRGTVRRWLILEALVALEASTRAQLMRSLVELSERAAGELDDVQAERAEFEEEPAVTESRIVIPADVASSVPFSRPGPTLRPLVPPTALVVCQTSRKSHAYFRCSARHQDPRVDRATGAFAAGTYAAPWSELPHVTSGFAAVGRFALPNPFAARRLHLIVTDSHPRWLGAAAPAFGQAGGGVEVFFPSGAQPLHGTPHVINDF